MLMPKIKNTVDSPRTKNNAATTARLRAALSSSISDTLTPPIYAKYGGTIGNTQGLRNDKIPAENAISKAGRSDAARKVSVSNIPPS